MQSIEVAITVYMVDLIFIHLGQLQLANVLLIFLTYCALLTHALEIVALNSL